MNNDRTRLSEMSRGELLSSTAERCLGVSHMWRADTLDLREGGGTMSDDKYMIGDRINVSLPAWLAEAKEIEDGETEGIISAITPKAVLLATEDDETWLPKSQISFEVVESQNDAFTKAARWKDDNELPPVPSTRHDPWEHQLRAYHFIAELDAAYLDMHMGTGKTKVVIDHVANFAPQTTLVVCPKSVVDVWPAEAAKHAQRDDIVVVPLVKGTVKERTREARQAVTRAERDGSPVVLVINYEAAWRPAFKRFALGRTWGLVVADEIHRIKKPGGKASMFMRTLGKRAKRRLGLSGTPLPHSPLDAYAQFRFLNPAIFGTSYHRFKHRYAVYGGYEGHEVLRWKNQRELGQKMAQISFHAGEEVLDIPAEKHVERVGRLTRGELKVYAQLEDEMIAEIEAGRVTVFNALTKLLRLQQVTSGYVRNDEGEDVAVGTSKRDLFADLLEDFERDEPLVVFCRFRHDLNTIKKTCETAGRTVGELSGRRNDIAEWRDGKFDVIAVQIQAGSLGIDLTRARFGIYYSLGFSLGDFRQSIRRINRSGQTRPVTYYHLIMKDTIDAKVYERLDARERLVEGVLDYLKRKKGAEDD